MGSFQQINMGFGGRSAGPVGPFTCAIFLAIGGGGGGGTNWGAGGGGGGVIQGTVQISQGTTLNITVGKGGCTAAFGANTVFASPSPSFNSGSSLIAYGGGSGPPFGNGGGAGAAGSPGYNVAYGYPSPAPTFNTKSGAQGYPGGTGGGTQPGVFGGGGGAGSIGGNGSGPGSTTGPAVGGNGYLWPYTNTTYGGGGGGGGGGPGVTPRRTSGGPGGGGPGSITVDTNPNFSPLGAGVPGTANLGGGGGGGSTNSGVGGTGGPGVAVLLIPTPVYPGSAPGAASVNNASPFAPGYTVITYTTPTTQSNTYTYIQTL
jgi:hypothetical protein